MNRTDWDRYYSSPMPTALWSRAIVRNHLLRLLRKTGLQENCTIAELGGGGSCFCGKIRKIFKPREYTVFDSCQSGLEHFLRKNKNCKAVQTDLLQWVPQEKYDLVFSVGLIEHFPPAETEELIRKHFEMTKPGGYVILFFPTPTVLYRMTRCLAELFRLWQFPDERPLLPDEVKKTAKSCGKFLKGYTFRSNFLSQHSMLYRKS